MCYFGTSTRASPKVVSREKLLEELWDDQSFVDENTLNVNMTRVRKRLTDYNVKSPLKQYVVLGIDLFPHRRNYEIDLLFLKEHIPYDFSTYTRCSSFVVLAGWFSKLSYCYLFNYYKHIVDGWIFSSGNSS